MKQEDKNGAVVLKEMLENMGGHIHTVNTNNKNLTMLYQMQIGRLDKMEEKHIAMGEDIVKLGVLYDTLKEEVAKIREDTSGLGEIKILMDSMTKTLDKIVTMQEADADRIRDLENRPAQNTHKAMGKIAWIVGTAIFAGFGGTIYLVLTTLAKGA